MTALTFLLLLIQSSRACRSKSPRKAPNLPFFSLLLLLLFFLLLQVEWATVQVARAFFIWVSLFNLFVVSVFWSFMADLFRNEQGRRLFPFIAAGGSLGALLGPSITALLAVPLGPVKLLLISALFLEIAVFCVTRLIKAPALAPERPNDPGSATGSFHGEQAIGGGILNGVRLVFRSPYLLGICLYILLFTTTSTFLYFQQAHIVAASFDDPAERTRIFAVIDLAVALLTILVQCAVAGRLITRFGVGVAVAVLPLLTALGFAALALAPTLAVLIGFQSLRRAANFAISKPAREILFTVVSPEEKYKSKNFIDTVVYRGGDSASGWAFAGLKGIGLDLPAIAVITVPLAGLWLIVGLMLGRKQETLAERPAT